MRSEKIAPRLVELQFVCIGISLDSAICMVHDEFRGVKGIFKWTMQGFRRLERFWGIRETCRQQDCPLFDALVEAITRHTAGQPVA